MLCVRGCIVLSPVAGWGDAGRWVIAPLAGAGVRVGT